jgi:hypothetical protein
MLLIKMFTPSGRCWIFLYGYQHLYLYHLWLLLYIQLNVELFIDACDKELLMWNLTREICTRGAEDVFCWNTVEEQVEIDSTGMFIMYIHVWPRCSTMEELGLFCRIGSAGRCSTWLDWNWSHIYNWSWYMTQVQHDGRAGFVLQDRLCRPLFHVIRLELISYIQLTMVHDWHMCANTTGEAKFPECHTLPRVPKIGSVALGEELHSGNWGFPECLKGHDTRGRPALGVGHLPRAQRSRKTGTRKKKSYIWRQH